jgi:hypothetical protein
MYVGLHEKQPSFLSDFNKTLNFSNCFCKTSTWNFTKICPADVELYYADERAAVMKRVNFRNSANAPTISLVRSFLNFLALMCSFYGKRWRKRTRLSWLPGVPCEVTGVGNNVSSSKNGLNCCTQNMIPFHSGPRSDKQLVKTYSHDPIICDSDFVDAGNWNSAKVVYFSKNYRYSYFLFYVREATCFVCVCVCVCGGGGAVRAPF